MNAKKIWADPVWSKVIAGGILAAIAAAYASMHWWGLLSAGAIQSWNYVVGDVVAPRWLFLALVLWTAGTIIVLALALIDSKHKTEAHWNTYEEDEFLGLRWRWRLSETGTPRRLCAFCPRCDFQLDNSGDTSYYALPAAIYECTNCRRTSVTLDESGNDVENRVYKLIQLALRDGSWKNAVRKG